MKLLCIVGSPRKSGNTDIILGAVIDGARECGAEIEKVYLSDLTFQGCIGCERCAKTQKCVLKDDMQLLYEKLEQTDGLIIGSPTYFYNVTALTKQFLDRLYAYEIFDPTDRSVWLSQNEATGLKYAVTVAVCEQEDIADMGFTSDTLSMTLSAVGWRSVANIKALHLFEKGKASLHPDLLAEAHDAGVKLYKTIRLSQKVKL